MAGHETQNAHLAEQASAPPASPVTSVPRSKAWSPWQSLFLARLSRLVHQDEEWRSRVPEDDWRIRLLHRAIYSTYCDCLALGLGDDARELVRRHRAGSV